MFVGRENLNAGGSNSNFNITDIPKKTYFKKRRIFKLMFNISTCSCRKVHLYLAHTIQ